MGACECENPMEFGYEVNAQEKDEQPSTKNKYKEYNPNTSNNNYMNNVSNVISTDSNRLKQSNYNTQGRIYEINENQNINNRPMMLNSIKKNMKKI